MTCHLTFAALVFLLAATTLWNPGVNAEGAALAARAPAQSGAGAGAGHGFAAAFGSGEALRNLLY